MNRIRGIFAILSLALLAACGSSEPVSSSNTPSSGVPKPPPGGCSYRVAGTKHAYFGDLHVHTRDSFDAYFFNSINGPREAYRFAKGEPAGLPSGDDDPNTQQRTVQLDRPLDFTAVTDHAEYLGDFRTICQAGGSLPTGVNPACNIIGNNTRANINALVNGDTPFTTKVILAGLTELPLTRFAWQQQLTITDEEYEPCSFTTLHGYEYSSQKKGQMLHRNVIFLGDNIPSDVFGSEQVTDVLIENNTNDEWRLFDHLQQNCVLKDGCQALTIPHSANLSDGRMFLAAQSDGLPVGRNGDPLTLADAKLRAGMDRAIEIHQHKGNSECAVGLEGPYLQGEESACDFELNKSVCTGLPNDPPVCAQFCRGDALRDPPFCNYRQQPTFAVSLCETVGINGGSGPTENCTTPLDMVRNALTEGLLIKQALGGVNPYRQAFIGSTDTHNGTPGNVQEKGWSGHGGVLDDEPKDQLGYWVCDNKNGDPADPANCSNRRFLDRGRAFNPGGLAGVWAEQNTREDIWNGLQRGESFATSGPRIRIRSYASWQAPPADICQRLASGEDLIAQGLPGARMGADLPARPSDAGPPYVVVWAMQDPGGDTPGAPLQRIDLIKGWYDRDGKPKVREYAGVVKTSDAVLPPSQTDCSVQAGRHPAQLCTIWRDPDFIAGRDSFYYARAMEVPSCRWSEQLCLAKQVDCSQLSAANGMFPESSGLRGYEGCCKIEGAPGSFRGARTFHTIEERAWASPIWYEPRAQ